MPEDLEKENINKSNDIQMQSDKIDQVNINHQSNMTLSAHSTITQSYYLIKINDDAAGEDVEDNGK